MQRITDIARLLAAALVAVVLVGALTPVCTMPECTDVAAGTCSDYAPACDECPDAVVMKHDPDEATLAHTVEIPSLEAIALVECATPALVSVPAAVPDQTASPPPLDPLGVRLTI